LIYADNFSMRNSLVTSYSCILMRKEFEAIIERDGEWYVAYSPEIPGANGQGRTQEEARKSLSEAIALILDDRREDALRGLPAEAIRDMVIVE
jgi:predicted RNase H-like HicB family nuclease